MAGTIENDVQVILHLGCDGYRPHDDVPGLHCRRDGQDCRQGAWGLNDAMHLGGFYAECLCRDVMELAW